MVEGNDFNKGKLGEDMGILDSKDIFSDLNVSDENTSDIFNAIMNSDAPDEVASVENGVENAVIDDGEKGETSGKDQVMAEDDSSFFSNDISMNSGSAGLDDDPFEDSLFAEVPQAAAGIDSDNPFAELENEKTAASVDDGNPFAQMNDDGNPFAQMEKAGKSNDSLVGNDDGSIFGDTGSPFASIKQGDCQEDISVDDFLKSIS